MKLLDLTVSPVGTFKRRFRRFTSGKGWNWAREAVLSNGRLKVGGESCPKTEPLLVLSNRRVRGLEEWLLRRPKTWMINPYVASHLLKSEVQAVCAGNGIPTPGFTVSTQPVAVPMKAVVKPNRGQQGSGVRRPVQGTRARYYQEFVGLPAGDLPTVFDLRVYTFLGKFLGSTLRMAGRTDEQEGTRFGVSNTHRGGVMAYFERGLQHRCPAERLGDFEAIRSWLGWSHPSADVVGYAERLTSKLGLGYAGTDFIFDAEKKPYVVETNPNAMHGYRTKADRIRMDRTLRILGRMKWTS